MAQVLRDLHHSFELYIPSTMYSHALTKKLGMATSYAIDTVYIYSNDTSIPDSVLSHRLGMLPVINSSLVSAHKVKLRIDCTGPVHIMSDDVVCVDGECQLLDNILIAKLRNGQKLCCEMVLSRGTAAVHAKYQSVVCIVSKPVADGYIVSGTLVGSLSLREVLLDVGFIAC
jgi:hypothetical protein